MFVRKWWAIWTKLPSLEGRWVSSWAWIQQQLVTVSCWLSLSISHWNLSPFLPWSGDTRGFWGADCWLSWSESKSSLLLVTGDSFVCTSWLRMLSGRDAPRLVWQGLALCSWAAPRLSTAALWLHQGYSTVGLAFFWRSWDLGECQCITECPAALCPQVWQHCLCTDACGTSPALQKCKGESSQTHFLQRGWVRFTWPARWRLRGIRKKNLASYKPPLLCAVVRARWAQTFPTSPRRTKLAQAMQRLACAWKSHPYFHLQMAVGTIGIKGKWNILVF